MQKYFVHESALAHPTQIKQPYSDSPIQQSYQSDSINANFNCGWSGSTSLYIMIAIYLRCGEVQTRGGASCTHKPKVGDNRQL